MLGEVIREIVFASSPTHVELALTDAIAHPTAAHVHCLGTSLLYGVVGDALRGVVVGADGSWSLLMAEFFKRGTLWDCVLAVVAQAAAFGFRCSCDDFWEVKSAKELKRSFARLDHCSCTRVLA